MSLSFVKQSIKTTNKLVDGSQARYRKSWVMRMMSLLSFASISLRDLGLYVQCLASRLPQTNFDQFQPDIKSLQIQLTGFLDKDTAKFCKELWSLCLSGQENPQGVPKELLEAKKLELIQEKVQIVFPYDRMVSTNMPIYRLRRKKLPKPRVSRKKPTRHESEKSKE